MASSWYANGIDKVTKGTINLNDSTLRAILLNSTGNANLQFDTHDFMNDIVAGWRANAEFPTVKSGFAIVGGSDHVNFGSGSQVINFSTVATGQLAKGIIIYHSGAGAAEAACELLVYNSFTSAVSTDGTDVDVTLNASGWGRASY